MTGVSVSGVSGILLGFGMANFAGTYLGGALLARSMRLPTPRRAVRATKDLELSQGLSCYWACVLGMVQARNGQRDSTPEGEMLLFGSLEIEMATGPTISSLVILMQCRVDAFRLLS